MACRRRFVELSLAGVFLLASPAPSAGAEVARHDSADARVYTFADGTSYTYARPTPFGWLKRGVTDLGPFARDSLAADNLGNLGLILGSTALLVHYDQDIYDSVSRFGARHGVDQGAGGSSVKELPSNFGEYLYFIGDGRVPVAIAGTLAATGYLTDDYRMMSTASQLAEVLVSNGLVEQGLKICLGRETPESRTQDGGAWHGPVNPREYVRNQTSYDAMPSGHLATAVATITVLAENYHEHEVAIWSAGSVLATLMSLQMINNGVHWAGDYPLAIGIGYSLGRQAARNNRQESGGRDSGLKFGIGAAGDGLLIEARAQF